LFLWLYYGNQTEDDYEKNSGLSGRCNRKARTRFRPSIISAYGHIPILRHLLAHREVSALKAVLQHLPKANSIDSAIAAAARDLNLPDFTVASWWKYFLRTQDKNTRAERDRAMLELVKAGWSNGDIAQRFGVSKNTVSRAISGYLHGGLRPCDRMRLRKRRKPSPPQQKSPV
jgi:DNA-binding NarL/FixJ family response regulator